MDVENISYVYLKTGNDSLRTLRYVENSGYSIVSRKDLIDILDKSKSENVILKDFLQNLWGIENRTNAFKAQPFSEWNEIPEAVQGFYLELERRLENANGGYVSNPTGGFWGLWWGFVSKASCRVYLQMENGHVRIKAECPDRGKSAEIKAIKEKFVYPWLEAEQRFRQGKFLTLAKVKDEFIYENGIVNIDEVVSKLRSLEDLLKAL